MTVGLLIVLVIVCLLNVALTSAGNQQRDKTNKA
jgi:hypothetical protein